MQQVNASGFFQVTCEFVWMGSTNWGLRLRLMIRKWIVSKQGVWSDTLKFSVGYALVI